MAELTAIESMRIQGFRSFADVSITSLPKATVFIGPNGSGKTNFIKFFAMMSFMQDRELRDFVAHQGGADDQLFGGSDQTPSLSAEVSLRTESGRIDYKFTLAHTADDRFFFAEEAFRFGSTELTNSTDWRYLGRGHSEAAIVERAKPGVSQRRSTAAREAARRIVNFFDICAIHDTSSSLAIRGSCEIEDNSHLHVSATNLAAVLYRLEQEDIRRYERICQQIRRILPGFDRFFLEENSNRVQLRWRAKWSNKTIGTHITSDGSLRFFALVTLLNLPSEMLPEVLLIDEPEVGLHPAAVSLIGEMIKSIATERQVIVTTQSPRLVDVFEIDEILVLDLHEGQTLVRHLSSDDYQAWLSEYSSGDLWEKNLFGGRP